MSRALAHIILATILLFCALVIGLRLFVSVSLPSIITPPLGIQVVQASNISGVLRATSTQLEKPKEGLNFNLTQINVSLATFYLIMTKLVDISFSLVSGKNTYLPITFILDSIADLQLTDKIHTGRHVLTDWIMLVVPALKSVRIGLLS